MASQRTSGPDLPIQHGVFTRASSGLVRQVKTVDVMFYGWEQIGIAYIIFIVFAWQFYPGANLALATLIATVTGIFLAICYSFVSVVYPRSGGDYVASSRALTPAVGMVLSISLAFWQIFYIGANGVFVPKYGVAPMLSTLGIQLHSSGLINAATWLSGSGGLFLGGTFIIVFFGFLQARGLGTYFKWQRYSSYLAIAGILFTILILTLAALGVFNFVHNFNSLAGAHAYQNVINSALKAGDNLTPHFSLTQTAFFSLWPAFSLWFAVLAISFTGEVKDTQRSQIIGMNAAIVTMGIAFVILFWLYQVVFGSQFMLASTMVPASKFPLPAAPFVNLYTGIAGGNPVLTVLTSTWVIAILFFVGGTTLVYASRTLLAWSLDGMAPRWFSAVSERRHTPIWNIIFCCAFSEIFVFLYAFTHLITALGGFLGQCVPFMGLSITAILLPATRKDDFESSSIAYRLGRIAVLSIVGVLSLIGVVFVFWRLLVDKNYGANGALSIWATVGLFALGWIWYGIYRYVERRRGVDIKQVFREIPVE
jgi:amino acid transporter